jgi:hypothetical protein
VTELKGERSLGVRLDKFTTSSRQKIEERIRGFTEELNVRIKAAAPIKTGKLRSEISPRIFTDSEKRIAGYVSVFAPGQNTEYAKAATLEYGSNKVRRRFEKSGIALRLNARGHRISTRLGKAAHIQAYRYLRDPLEQMRPQIEAGLNEALVEAAEEDE